MKSVARKYEIVCLSLLSHFYKCKRYKTIKMRYLTSERQTRTKNATGCQRRPFSMQWIIAMGFCYKKLISWTLKGNTMTTVNCCSWKWLDYANGLNYAWFYSASNRLVRICSRRKTDWLHLASHEHYQNATFPSFWCSLQLYRIRHHVLRLRTLWYNGKVERSHWNNQMRFHNHYRKNAQNKIFYLQSCVNHPQMIWYSKRSSISSFQRHKTYANDSFPSDFVRREDI